MTLRILIYLVESSHFLWLKLMTMSRKSWRIELRKLIMVMLKQNLRNPRQVQFHIAHHHNPRLDPQRPPYNVFIVQYEPQYRETSKIHSKWSICHNCYIQSVSSVCFEGIVHFCNLCDHKATRQYQLKTHQQSNHEGLRYSCNQCEYQATRQDQLKTH
jgi:hypothetical protein